MSAETRTAPFAPPGARNGLRQALGVARLELRKALVGRRAWGLYLLALAPVAIMAMKAIFFLLFADEAGLELSLANEETIFAEMYQSLMLRLSIFFGAVLLFMNLFRGDLLDRTLHYYFLLPARREMLVAGKYLAALLASALVFGAATLVARGLMYLPYGWNATLDHLGGTGLATTLSYLFVTVLACVGYGAVFLVVGMVWRNPIVPAIVIFGWESLNIFLPPPLRYMSVIYYLTSLCPVPVSAGPIALTATPAPWPVATAGILGLSLALLAVAGWRARTMEVDYGEE